MCGLFGYVGSKPVNVEVLARIAIDTERKRGGHAFGFAWIDHRWRLRHFKAPGRIESNIGDLDAVQGARLVIGHCRYATHGAPMVNGNNHPHSCDGGWFAHNGTIPNHWQIASRHGVQLTSECDSELVARLIEVSPRRELLGRFKHAVEQSVTHGTRFAALGLWRKPLGLYVARAGNPLHGMLDASGKGTYLASLAESLPGQAHAFLDNTVRALKLTETKGRKIVPASVVMPLELRETKPRRPLSGDLFSHLPHDERCYRFTTGGDGDLDCGVDLDQGEPALSEDQGEPALSEDLQRIAELRLQAGYKLTAPKAAKPR